MLDKRIRKNLQIFKPICFEKFSVKSFEQCLPRIARSDSESKLLTQNRADRWSSEVCRTVATVLNQHIALSRPSLIGRLGQSDSPEMIRFQFGEVYLEIKSEFLLARCDLVSSCCAPLRGASCSPDSTGADGDRFGEAVSGKLLSVCFQCCPC